MVVEFCWSVVTIVALKTMFPASFLPSLANPMVDTHPMNLPGISFNEADGKVLLVSQPVAGRPTVDGVVLHALLFEHGFGDCQLDSAAITSAANLCNVQQTPFGLEVARRLDAVIALQVELDDMQATLSLTAARGGKAATAPDVLAALAQAGVVFGADVLAVTQACEAGSCKAILGQP